jgi:hypothetical protein
MIAAAVVVKSVQWAAEIIARDIVARVVKAIVAVFAPVAAVENVKMVVEEHARMVVLPPVLPPVARVFAVEGALSPVRVVVVVRLVIIAVAKLVVLVVVMVVRVVMVAILLVRGVGRAVVAYLGVVAAAVRVGAVQIVIVAAQLDAREGVLIHVRVAAGALAPAAAELVVMALAAVTCAPVVVAAAAPVVVAAVAPVVVERCVSAAAPVVVPALAETPRVKTIVIMPVVLAAAVIVKLTVHKTVLKAVI